MERYKQPLDCYDVLPPAMVNYLRYNGPHFTEKLCRFAVSKMKMKDPVTGKAERMKMIDREEYRKLMSDNSVVLENDVLCDGLYVFNMAMSNCYGSSLPDHRTVCLHVKDTVDDIDQADGFIFNRFYADMSHLGIPIPWEDVL